LKHNFTKVKEKLQWTKRIKQDKVDNLYLKRFGKKYKEYRQLWNKAGKDFLPDFPIHIDIELIDACNLACIHCFRNEEIARKMGITINTGARFPLNIFKEIMDEGKAYGLKAINLGFSGECLLRDDICELINIAYESGVLDIRLITNGILITHNLAERLLNSRLTFLSMSIDATTSKTYENLKGKDCFKQLEDNLTYLIQKKKESRKDFPLIRGSFYTSPENQDEFGPFLEKYQDNFDFIDCQDFKDLRNVKKHKKGNSCKMPFQRLAIFANGDVAPCCSFFSKKLIVGNITQSSVKEIWDSKIMKGIRKGLENKGPSKVCGECLQTIG
jgi:radical SAM protein with 4Fe4S-binding SPASM domain